MKNFSAKKNIAIVIGDSYANTLGMVRSLGEAKIEQYVILVTQNDESNIRKSKYLDKKHTYIVSSYDDIMLVLQTLKEIDGFKTIMCSSDIAAEWVDAHEKYLYMSFRTPTRGKRIGGLFNKKRQCELAEECGLVIPKSIMYKKGEQLNIQKLEFPLLMKPLESIKGSKEDIHICHSVNEIKEFLHTDTSCNEYIIQEYIKKDYDLDCIGVRTDNECIIAGAIKKIRNYPNTNCAGSYGYFDKAKKYNINENGVKKFMEKVGYYGPFSVEFVHKDGKNYFMEVNFRNDGLAYVATAAGLNLHSLYAQPNKYLDFSNFQPIYMMNLCFERAIIKRGDMTYKEWWPEFRKTKCFIDINKHDLKPYLWCKINSIKRLLKF